MAPDIQDLMNRTVQNEADKRRLELNVLQTQVNPHFLYNTLNSIKWMATIQRNSGISEMTTALSRLLRNMAKGVSDKISLEEELSIVKDYVLIQQYRYSDKFVVDYNIDQSILKYKIVKFTLQPLVENAIFHGIAPGEQSGTIVIEAKKVLDNIEISVIDSGVGMTSNQLNEVLQNTHSKKDRLNSIGISNVRERLMLIYGESYGLSISSQQNYGTIVVITIPCEE
jgi:two-component system sensor histidine kinase YesM